MNDITCSKKPNTLNSVCEDYYQLIQAISIAPTTTIQSCSRHRTDTVSEGLAQGPYVAARAGVEPMTLQTKGVGSTNAPHTPQNSSARDLRFKPIPMLLTMLLTMILPILLG